MSGLAWRWAGGCLLMMMLTACAHQDTPFRDRNKDYPQARAVEYPLPDSIVDRRVSVIPALETPLDAPRAAPRPPPLRATTAAPLVDWIDGEATRVSSPWLLIQRSPGEVWPALYQFAQMQSTPIFLAEPRQGLLQWASEAEPAKPIQQVQLRQGVRRGTAEVRLLTLEQGALFPATALISLAELAEFLEQALLEQQGVSLRAQGLHTAGVARIIESEQRKQLMLALPFDRAWDTLQRLLQHSAQQSNQATLLDLDRQQGVFYLNYQPESMRQQSWWARRVQRQQEATSLYQLQLASLADDLIQVRLMLNEQESAPVAIEEEFLYWLERQLR